MKAPQDLHRLGHRFGSEKAGTKHAFAQARNLAVFVDGTKAATREPRDLQPDRIGTDINRGKGWHERKANSLHATACEVIRRCGTA